MPRRRTSAIGTDGLAACGFHGRPEAVACDVHALLNGRPGTSHRRTEAMWHDVNNHPQVVDNRVVCQGRSPKDPVTRPERRARGTARAGATGPRPVAAASGPREEGETPGGKRRVCQGHRAPGLSGIDGPRLAPRAANLVVTGAPVSPSIGSRVSPGGARRRKVRDLPSAGDESAPTRADPTPIPVEKPATRTLGAARHRVINPAGEEAPSLNGATRLRDHHSGAPGVRMPPAARQAGHDAPEACMPGGRGGRPCALPCPAR